MHRNRDNKSAELTVTDRSGESIMKYADVPQILFKNKQNIPWNDVEQYLKKYIGKSFPVKEYGDIIHVAGEFPDEFTESQYTKKLRGGLAKAKANMAQVIGEMLENAENRRWIENKEEKHKREASGGWYRYDVGFTIPIEEAGNLRRNVYRATAVVRINTDKLYLYDIVNIKKEASTPL